jgi:hypothetical protein
MNMRKRNFSILTLLLSLGILIHSPSWGGSIPVAAGDWSGSRATPNGSGVAASEVVEDDWTNDEDGFQFSWTVTKDSVYHYAYQLKNKNGC